MSQNQETTKSLDCKCEDRHWLSRSPPIKSFPINDEALFIKYSFSKRFAFHPFYFDILISILNGRLEPRCPRERECVCPMPLPPHGPIMACCLPREWWTRCLASQQMFNVYETGRTSTALSQRECERDRERVCVCSVPLGIL